MIEFELKTDKSRCFIKAFFSNFTKPSQESAGGYNHRKKREKKGKEKEKKQVVPLFFTNNRLCGK